VFEDGRRAEGKEDRGTGGRSNWEWEVGRAMKWLSRELSLISLWPQWIYCLHSQQSCAKSLSRQSNGWQEKTLFLSPSSDR